MKEEFTRTIPTDDEMVDRARKMIPTLLERAAATEENRSVLPQTIQEFVDAGLYRILQPTEYGGYAMDITTLYRVTMQLARGCPSSAWCYVLVASHNWQLPMIGARAADEVWARDAGVRMSSSFAPFGKARAVEGGFMVSGRWPWSSGCDHCDWALVGALVPSDSGGRPVHRAFLVPRTQYDIIDTWYVFGLKGTGSKDIGLRGEVFVPEYRSHNFSNFLEMREVGHDTFKDRTYRYPFGVMFAYCLASVAIGVAEGAQTLFVEQMRERTSAVDGAKAIEDPAVRQRIAESDTLIRGMHGRMDANLGQIRALIDADRAVPMELRVHAKWDALHIVRTAMQAVDLCFKASGARGIRLDNPIQRYFRDMHTISNHGFLNADKGAQNAGLFELTGVNADPMV